MPHAEDLTVGPGDLVAVRLAPGPEWPGLVRRMWETGAALFPVDHRLPPSGAAALVEHADPTHVLGESGLEVRPHGGGADPTIALVVATSGTGGDPRLVELSRSAVEAAVRGSAEALGEEGGRWLCCLPVGHVGGLLSIVRPVVLGGEVVVHPRFDPALVAAEPDIDFLSLVPTMLGRLLESGSDLRRFRAILVGGAALAPELAERARRAGARVVRTYGATETCGGVVYDGAPLAGTEIRIEAPAKDGTGEILVRGPTVMSGYRRDPRATAEAFAADGWLRTGDVGRLEDDGRLRVDGRLDDLILTGGEKVWPDEIEAVLRTHPKVADVAVAGRPDPEWGERVTAFVVPEDPAAGPSLEELRDHVVRSLARFKAPRDLVRVPSIPRTPSGKIRRGALPDPDP